MAVFNLVANRKLQTKIHLWISICFETLVTRFLVGLTSYIKNSLSRLGGKISMPDPSDFGLQCSLVSFPSKDGLLLRGWWFGTENIKPVIILLHGIRANRAEPPERVFALATRLISQGYNVLAFDFRAHGESEGNSISAGYYEKNDLLGAVDYIRNRGIRSKIGVLGFSMGAAISLITAAESPDISAVVADSAYVDVISLIKWKLSRWKFLSAFLVPLILLVTKILYKIDFSRVKPLESVKKIKVPVFIIHGGKDTTVPVQHAYRLRGACRNRDNQFWVVPEAAHTDAFSIHTEEYLARVTSFFRHAFALT
jgi:uncharacterized protein